MHIGDIVLIIPETDEGAGEEGLIVDRYYPPPDWIELYFDICWLVQFRDIESLIPFAERELKFLRRDDTESGT